MVNILEDARHSSVLYICKYFVILIFTMCRDAGHPGGGTQCTTVIYTVNARPIVCENPFRKVFARRQQFYKARERRTASPDPSSKRLLWRPCDHACRRNSLCPDRQPPPPPADDERAATLPSPSPRFFTLNAHIQPFAAFSIRHDLSSGSDQEMSSSSCSAVNLTLCSDKSQPVEVLPDGQVNKKRTTEQLWTRACPRRCCQTGRYGTTETHSACSTASPGGDVAKWQVKTTETYSAPVRTA